MRVPNADHSAHPWVIEQIAPDFTLLDAWALPVHGRREDFASFLEVGAAVDPARASSTPTRALFAVRARLGEWFRWDDAPNTRLIPGCAETTLAARLPAQLRNSAGAVAANAHGFVPLYRTDTEYAAELSNATVHGVLQLAWVEERSDRYRGQLAVYVKPRGVFGSAYLRLIAPFRHLVVYPALTRQMGIAWNRGARRHDEVTTLPRDRSTPVG